MMAAILGESEMVQGSGVRVVILRIVGVLVAAGLLAGCDSCGDFLPPIKFQSQVCKQEAPRPL
jgi:hypothetical protein